MSLKICHLFRTELDKQFSVIQKLRIENFLKSFPFLLYVKVFERINKDLWTFYVLKFITDSSN